MVYGYDWSEKQARNCPFRYLEKVFYSNLNIAAEKILIYID